MKTKMMEAKFYEEKLKLQQKHDADVQKVGYIRVCCVQNFLCSRACDGAHIHHLFSKQQEGSNSLCI